MARFTAMLCALLLLLAATAAQAESITLVAADGVKVHAEFWPASAAAPAGRTPLIVAFHQAGSSSAEYTPLAPRLNRAGFHVLAIDQRSGGTEFGGKNRTVAALGRATDYDAALPDLEAALAWGHQRAGGAPVLVWGSSYSAALVFLLAARHPGDVQGVLAFSPDEYLNQRGAVARAAQSLRVPVFVAQAGDEAEIEASRQVLAAVPGAAKTLFIAKGPSVHGSATLRADRNPRGAEESWAAVLAFLAPFKPRP